MGRRSGRRPTDHRDNHRNNNNRDNNNRNNNSNERSMGADYRGRRGVVLVEQIENAEFKNPHHHRRRAGRVLDVFLQQMNTYAIPNAGQTASECGCARKRRMMMVVIVVLVLVILFR
jgi:hypothetical protein